MTREEATTHDVRGMSRDLVNWLWAFLFCFVGLDWTLSPRTAIQSQGWLATLARIVLTAVGGAALLLCSLTIWREIRRKWITPARRSTDR